jgi:hypothetical protein
MNNEEARDTAIEGLVEKQARGEAAGVPEEGASSGAAELDTRRSKSALLGGALLGQTHVDIPGAEVDSQAFIAQQTGISLDAAAPEATVQHALAPEPSVIAGGREVDVAYPDVVDRPEYIEAHMRPFAVDVSTADAEAPITTAPVAAEVAPSQVALDANQYPDAVDRPEYIAGHAGNPLAPDPQHFLAEERTPETEVQIGPSQPG